MVTEQVIARSRKAFAKSMVEASSSKITAVQVKKKTSSLGHNWWLSTKHARVR
jgi:hypothetical protein